MSTPENASQTQPNNGAAPVSFGAKILRLFFLSTVVLLIVVLLALTTISTLLSTNIGSQWLLNQALARVQSDTLELSIEHSLGTALSGLDLQGVRLKLDDNTVTINSLQSRWNPMSLLSGEFVLDLLSVKGVHVDWHSTEAASEPTDLGTDPFAGLVPLPLDIRFPRVAIEDATLQFDDTSLDVQSLVLAGSLVNKHLQIRQLQVVSTPIQVDLQAEFDLIANLPLDGRLSWAYTGPITQDFEDASGDLHFSGNLNTLRINHQLNSPLEMTSDGELLLHLLSEGVAPTPSFELRHNIVPQVLAANSVSSNEQIRIESAEISTLGDFNIIDFSGNARLAVQNAQGRNLAPSVELSWATTIQGQQLSISQASVTSNTGSVLASGSLQWADPLQLSMQLDIQENDGSQYQPFLPEGIVLGALNGSAQLELLQNNDQLEGSLSIASLTGELNHYPLLIDGDLRYGADGLEIDELNAQSGTTQLSVDGTWADTIDFNWKLDANDLSTLSPLLQGSINAVGAIKGTPETPQIDLTANAQNLDLAGIRVAGFSARGEYLNNSNTMQMTVEGIEYSDNANQHIDTLNITANGLPAEHTLALSVESPMGETQWTLSGALLNDPALHWEGLLQNGEIDSDLGIWSLTQASTMRLSQDAVDLPQQCWQQLPSVLCFEGNWQADGTVSANLTLGDYPLNHFNAPSVESQGQARVAPLLPSLPVGSRADGMLNANINVAGQISSDLSTLTAQFSVDAGEGQIEVEPAPAPVDDNPANTQEPLETQTFYWRAANITGSLENNQWALNSALDFYQPNLADSGMSVQGNADAQLLISANRALDGQLNLAFDDLSWIEAFVPSMQNTQGRLQGLSIISGTVEAPQFGGNLSLVDAAVDIPELGLELRDIETTVTSDISQTLMIQGKATSGDGDLRFVSEIQDPLSATRTFNVTLEGQDFTLINDLEILLKITPELRLEGNGEAIHISGNLTLPVVDVRITSLPESAVDVSADTVLVSNGSSTIPVHNAADGNPSIFDGISITSELKIALGDEARFRGFGLDTELAGALEITQRETGGPLTYGELTVEEGSFQTYGRTLTIEHGKLLFFGSLDNPALDIRAVRQAENVKVGVQMNGTLRNIRSQLFSTPTLPDGDIIAVMLTGRPIAEIGTQQDSNALLGAITSLGINKGQSLTNQVRNQLGLDTLAITSSGDTTNSSLTLGKYLTPKLFIRYGVGLFETESTLSVDYSLSEKIKLEAKSGSTQSVDIKYTVER